MNECVNILVIDDDLKNIQVAVNILKHSYHYKLVFATSGQQALERVKERDFDLILLDIIMQPMDGFEVCRHLKKNPLTRDIPIIFLTAKTDIDSIVKGFELGGVDYITKPFNPYELNARVQTHLHLKCLHDKQIESVQKEVIMILGDACEFRSEETGNHVQRVSKCCALLAELHGLSPRECDLLEWASPLHDIGKIAIPDSILHKPGKLSPEEFDIIKTHTGSGYDILKQSSKPLLQAAAIIAHEHHEYWDGNGYPRGLRGEDIHMYGRIVAIIDVFDALLHKRVYKAAWPMDEVKSYMISRRETQFDPVLLDRFIQNMDRFEGIVCRINA